MKREILIVGGGTAGWMTASLLAKEYAGENVTITLVEDINQGIIGVGEGSTPILRRFFERLGLSEAQWMPECNATYKLNIKFKDWSPSTNSQGYSHPFFSQTDIFTQDAFEKNCRNRRFGLDVNTKPDDFFLSSVLSNSNKSPLASDGFPFSIGYGYHFDSALLGEFLAKHCVGQGVIHENGKVVDVSVDERGSIESVTTLEGDVIAADLFFDCTGFSSRLMSGALGVEFRSFKSNLFNDSAIAIPTEADKVIRPETTSTALKNGWCWRIPLSNRVGNGYVYSSAFTDQDAAEIELRNLLGKQYDDVPARHLKMKVGQLDKHWQNNCVAVGLSQGFIEPLEATALHLSQETVERFLDYYRKGNFSTEYQAAFNDEISERFEKVRDYIVAHYKLNSRHDSEYWAANRDNTNLSGSLLRILDVWYRKENLSLEIEKQKISTHFNAMSWLCLLSGYGAYPELLKEQPSLNKVDFYHHQKVGSFLLECSKNFTSNMTA